MWFITAVEVKPDSISLTLSEARWLATTFIADSIRRRMEKERRRVLMPLLPPGCLDGVVEIGRDIRGARQRVGFALAQACMLRVEYEPEAARLGEHPVTVGMNEAELNVVYKFARSAYADARRNTMGYDAHVAETERVATALLGPATLSEPVQASVREGHFISELNTLQMAGGIVAAIDQARSGGSSSR